jgi:hypothetical protein
MMEDVVITIVAGMGMGAVSTALVLGVLIYTLFKRAGLLPGNAPEVRLRVQPDPQVAAAPYSTLDEDEDDAEAEAEAEAEHDLTKGRDAAVERAAAADEQLLAEIARRRLQVLAEPGICSTCKSFDLAGGQRLLSANPAFRAAAEWVPPWRMGRALKTKPNPEYLALVAERDAAEGEARQAVERRLEAIPPEVPLEEEEQVEPSLLHLDWTQFGACLTHSEIRAGSDTCDKHTPKAGAAAGAGS